MTHRNIGAKNLFGVACALALIASGCSLSSTASDSTTTLPSVTTPSSSDVASSDDSASTSDAVQSAAERYGTDVETTTPPTLTDADTITTAGLGPVRIGHTLEEAQEAARAQQGPQLKVYVVWVWPLLVAE